MNFAKLIRLDSNVTAAHALLLSLTERLQDASLERARWQNRLRQIGEPDTERRMRDGKFVDVPITPSAGKAQALREITDLDAAIEALKAERAAAEEVYRPLKRLHSDCLEFLKSRGLPLPVQIDPTAPRAPAVHRPGYLIGAPEGEPGMLGAGTPADRRA